MMNNKLKAIALTAIMGAQSLVPVFAQNKTEEISNEKITADFRVLAITDLHANLMDYDYYQDVQNPNIGLSRVATLIEEAKAEVNQSENEKIDNLILVDNGDTIQGTPLANVFAMNEETRTKPGEKYPIYEALDLLGFDATTAGNHEFNYGMDFINQITDKEVFNTSFVSANTYDMEGNPLFDQYVVLDETIIDDNGNEQVVKIGITGFVPPQILNWDKQHLDGKVQVEDIKNSADKVSKILKEEEDVDIVVALAHSGFGFGTEHIEGEEQAALQLTQVEGLDVIVSGHSHRLAHDTVNGIQIVKPGNAGNALGVVDLKLVMENGKWTINDDESTTELRLVSELKPKNSPLITENETLMNAHQATLDYINTPVGKNASVIETYLALVRDSNAVQLISDAQKWYLEEKVKAGEFDEYKDLPILSSAAPFRVGIALEEGDLVMKDLANVYLYDNTITVLKLTGAQVKEWLEMTSGMYNTIDPNSTEEQQLINPDFRAFNFDTIDGVTYEVDVTKENKYDQNGNLVNPNTSRIVNLEYNGSPIDLDQEFLVATNNYRAGGAFPGIIDGETVFESTDENRMTIMEYIKSFGTIDVKADNNWSIKGINTNANVVFTAKEEAKTVLRENDNIKPVETLENGNVKYSYDLNTIPTDFDNHWAKDVILDAMDKGIVDNSTEFRPNDYVTRSELAKMVATTFGVEEVQSGNSFSDVVVGNWHYGYVNALKNLGIVNGYGDNTFIPNTNTTRAEAAMMIANAHTTFKTANVSKFTSEDANGNFVAFNGTSSDIVVNGVQVDSKTSFKDDATIPAWVDSTINSLSNSGVITGFEDNTFRPNGLLTRAEALVMLSR
ncbi:MAG: bifunctional 2',3'-cyclic-nucleotide 2'-phosphodiesterase/3'-nucleotidase [Peptostreptococcaceae bacterium]